MTDAFTASVPRLETQRLTMREYRREDFDAFANHFADTKSTIHLALVDREAAWRIFSSHAGLWLLQGSGWWAIEVRQTGEVVGNIGGFFRESSPVMEVGANIYRRFWRHGFVFEAVAAVLDYAFGVRGEPMVQVLTSRQEKAMLRIAQSQGWIHDGDREVYGRLVDVYTKSRESWTAISG